MPSRRTAALGATLLLLLSGLAACGDGAGGSAGPGGSGGETTLTVYAAASLTAPFEAIGAAFEREHPGVRVDLSFGGSSDLVAQLAQGAPADVFASADTANMDKLTAEGLAAGDPRDFATNTLEIATPPSNPAGISSFADLADDDVLVVVCAPEVPCGAAAVRAEEVAGVRLRPVSEEQSVTDVLGKVRSGEADAGLVYVTDVRAAGADVHGVPFPEAAGIVNTYPIVALEGSDHADLARALVELVLGPSGQAILAEAGFARP